MTEIADKNSGEAILKANNFLGMKGQSFVLAKSLPLPTESATLA